MLEYVNRVLKQALCIECDTYYSIKYMQYLTRDGLICPECLLKSAVVDYGVVDTEPNAGMPSTTMS